MYKKICITNRHLVKGNYLQQLKNVLENGVDILILREKDLSEKEYLEVAKEVISLCEKYETKCILHYFINVAKNLNYPFVHVTYSQFMNMTDSDKRAFEEIGVSTHSIDEAIQCKKSGATYITFSHIFETKCKDGLKPRGIEALKEVVELTNIKVYALGGINNDNKALCVEAGADGICMMSEYMI